MIATIRKMIEGVSRRIALMVAKGIINTISDRNGIQTLQVGFFEDEIRNNVNRYQEYGFTSVPKKGAEAIGVFVGGNRDHGIIIAVDDKRYRLRGLEGGEVALYTDEGDNIHLKRNHKIEINATGLNSQVIVNAKSVQLGGPSVNPLDGVVTGACSCMAYGVGHSLHSTTVKAIM